MWGAPRTLHDPDEFVYESLLGRGRGGTDTVSRELESKGEEVAGKEGPEGGVVPVEDSGEQVFGELA